jgi:phospholipid N-methyltransferase
MPVPVRRAILKASFEALRPGGRFVQFTYGPTVPVPPSVLAELGLHARSAGFVVRNVPPARIWVFERVADRPA